MYYDFDTTVNSLTEVLTTLHWYMKFQPNDTSLIPAPDPSLLIRCTTTSTPRIQDSSYNQIDIAGHNVSYVGKTTRNGDISMTFVEGTDLAVLDYFSKWSMNKWSVNSGSNANTKGSQAYTKKIRATITLILQDPAEDVANFRVNGVQAGSNGEVLTYKLLNCLPSLEMNPQLNQNATPVEGTLTVHYDDFHVYKGGENGTLLY